MKKNILLWVWLHFGEPNLRLEYLLEQNNHRGIGVTFYQLQDPEDAAINQKNLYEENY